jgi:hypothetical protein
LKAIVPNKFVIQIPEKWDPDKLFKAKSKDIEIQNNKIYITLHANQLMIPES